MLIIKGGSEDKINARVIKEAGEVEQHNVASLGGTSLGLPADKTFHSKR